ncbi:MAG: hypothetical protein M1822_002292 [Bathelium mastoideum]|nr:MAG: hypothetical protein M1822_002292 [Bathelium mastoideum]
MSALNDDLRAFHLSHYGRPLPAESLAANPTSYLAESFDDEDDDGLGYYPDGVKRTLTDEQIAIFRHTEIQTLLRERRRQRASDAANETDSSDELSRAKAQLLSRLENDQEDSHAAGSAEEPNTQFEPEQEQENGDINADIDMDTGSIVSNSTGAFDYAAPGVTKEAHAPQRIVRHPELGKQQRKNLKARRRRKEKMKEDKRLRQISEAKTPRRKAREKDELGLDEADLDYDHVNEVSIERGEELEPMRRSTSDVFSRDEEDESNLSIKAAGTVFESPHPPEEKTKKPFLWPQIKMKATKHPSLDY